MRSRCAGRDLSPLPFCHYRQRTRDTFRGAEAERQRVAHGQSGAKRQESAAVGG